MSDENVNETEETRDAEAVETEPEASESIAEAEVVDEPAAEEPAAEPEPMVAEAAPAAEAEEPVTDEPQTEPAESADPVAEAPASARKKKKRLPRSLRSQRTKAKREAPTERKPITRLPKPEHARGRRQERQGTVVSAAADKTIVVRVDVAKVHPMYKKVIKRSTRFHAHDEGNQAKVGDVVRIVETRPISRMKRWRLQEIVEAAK